jgi:hypothetical protein
VPWLKFESMPYTVQKALKVSISKIIGLMSSGLLLWLGLCHMAEAVNAAHASHLPSSADPAGRKAGQVGVYAAREKLKIDHRIEGEVLRVEGSDYFVKGKDGQEIRLYSDPTTRKFGNISQGGNRSRFFVKDVASHTASSGESPTDQRYSRL